MIEIFFQIIIATLLISLISFVGVFTLSRKVKLSNNILGVLVSFAAGAIIAAVFFDLLPETFEALHSFSFVIVGIIFFFVLEAIIHWHHHGGDCEHHDHSCHKKPVVYLNLIGDGLHNFLDGVLIAASFMLGPTTGIATSIAVAAHEIPQEFGDFAILVKGGLSKKRALLLNFVSAMFAVIGGVLAFWFLASFQNLIPYAVSLAAGGLLYIATADILPELHKERDYKKIVMQILAFLVGVLLLGMIFSAGAHEHNHEVGEHTHEDDGHYEEAHLAEHSDHEHEEHLEEEDQDHSEEERGHREYEGADHHGEHEEDHALDHQ